MYERITAADIRKGDRVGRTRNSSFPRVIEVASGERSRYVTVEEVEGARRGAVDRIRPRHTAKLWRLVG